MKLPHQTDKQRHSRHLPFRRRIAFLILLGLAVAVVLAASMVFLGPKLRGVFHDYAVYRGFSTWDAVRGPKQISLTEAYLELPIRVVESFLPNEEQLPRLFIDIGFRNLQSLREDREEAFKRGIIQTGSDDFVTATIRHDGRAIPVRLRLKGDWLGHVEGKKWSFRVHVRDNDHLMGMRRFSLHHPKERAYQAEPLFLSSLRRQGILTPRYFFVEVVINGDDIGIMAVEEHFSKELLENQGRHDGVILRFDQYLLYQERESRGAANLHWSDPPEALFGDLDNVPIEAFRSGRIHRSEVLSRNYEIAVGLLRSFVAGRLRASEVFDTDLVGKFLAVSDLWGAQHHLNWENLVFYLNPVTLKLEPIGFDASLRSRVRTSARVYSSHRLGMTWLADDAVQESYDATLRMLVDSVLEGGMLADLRELESSTLSSLRNEFYFLEPYPLNELRVRARALSMSEEDQSLDATLPPYRLPALAHVFHYEHQGRHFVEIGNATDVALEVRDIVWQDNGSGRVDQFRPNHNHALPLVLPPRPENSMSSPLKIEFHQPSEDAKLDLLVTIAVMGQQLGHVHKAMRYAPALSENPVPGSTIEEQLSRHHFLSFDGAEHGLVVAAGSWLVDGSIVVPRDYSLTIPPATNLVFSPGEGVVSHGRIMINGEPGKPVVLDVTDNSTPEEGWFGVAVLSHDSSFVNHAVFRNTTGIHDSGWKLTGGVSFYGGFVEIRNSRFEHSLGEDALNIVRSRFVLRETDFSDTASDALDIDFGNGSIQGGSYFNIGLLGGADAIDASGSYVTINDAVIRDVSDKGVSVGERSEVVLSGSTIEACLAGAASKDGSKLKVFDTSFRDIRLAALMGYSKKPELGAGSIEAHQISLDNAEIALVQHGSDVEIDGEEIAAVAVDVDSLYRTIMARGAVVD